MASHNWFSLGVSTFCMELGRIQAPSGLSSLRGPEKEMTPIPQLGCDRPDLSSYSSYCCYWPELARGHGNDVLEPFCLA